MAFLIFVLGAGLAQASTDDDPRMAIPSVRDCLQITEGFLSSNEYSTPEQEQAIIGACRDADLRCVREAGDTMDSLVRSKAATFLPVVRACRGHGMGSCLSALMDRLPSFEHNKPDQILALLKKCE